MENRIKEYEKFIAKAAKSPTRELADYHAEMVANFQHERLVHLIIMLFFVFLTLFSIAAMFFIMMNFYDPLVFVPICLLAAILFILSLFYIKHYYFLENHIQKLYKYNKILHKL
ncbi:hypothetical protein IKG16_02330 [Candidatus Saccharibacteria bacterium]|nr:hypothetical protein [Candidatus Saccharibacteria bacterium]MBR3323699.1 hypothetical protein [Candidatus Saccharibacteria bacterium]